MLAGGVAVGHPFVEAERLVLNVIHHASSMLLWSTYQMVDVPAWREARFVAHDGPVGIGDHAITVKNDEMPRCRPDVDATIHLSHNRTRSRPSRRLDEQRPLRQGLSRQEVAQRARGVRALLPLPIPLFSRLFASLRNLSVDPAQEVADQIPHLVNGGLQEKVTTLEQMYLGVG